MNTNGTILLGSAEISKLFSSYITSRDWWVIVPMDGLGEQWAGVLEQDFHDLKPLFDGPDDIHVIVNPRVVGRIISGIYFVKRTQFSLGFIEELTQGSMKEEQHIILLGNDFTGADAVKDFILSAVDEGTQALSKGIQA
jgi:hypothetical protein